MSIVDPAIAVINVATAALAEMYSADIESPPAEKGNTRVRFLLSDDSGLPYWDGSCDESPFLWVRVQQRFRSTRADFPGAFVRDFECGVATIKVMSIELGVARCSTAEANPSWDELEAEAWLGLDDAWRIESALLQIACALGSKTRAVATDSVAPIGPEGGAVAWTGVAHVQY